MLTREEKKFYLEKECIAYYSGWSGIEIKDINSDYVTFVAGAWYGKPSVHRTKIYWSSEEPYFRSNGNRIYLKDCLRREI